MNIAVVGAGIFGVTIATRLRSLGHITIFDRNNAILTSASHANQLRLHRGYHYPRSPETVKDLLKSVSSFRDAYGSAIVDDNDHYYAISKRDSLVPSGKYLKFCDDLGLEYEVVTGHPMISCQSVDLILKVRESSIDYDELRRICLSVLERSDVEIRLGENFTPNMIDDFDAVINCTYANINGISPATRDYQFEVCEKILVDMPTFSKKQSIVIMDGPFMCIDPYGRTDLFLLGNVVHAIHASNVGTNPIIPEHLSEYIDKGLVVSPKVTNFEKFIDSGVEFIPELARARHVGSLFTVRAVLPRLDATDARPTIVTTASSKVINVFSGKIDTCSQAAESVLSLVRGIS